MTKDEQKGTTSHNKSQSKKKMWLFSAFAVLTLFFIGLVMATVLSLPKVEEVASTSGQNESPATVTAEISSDYEQVINRSYPIKAGYVGGTGTLVSLRGFQFEEKTAAALDAMLKDLEATGLSVVLKSGYRTDEDQVFLYERQIQRQGGNKEKAATVSALPLTSEHQAGLAVDISSNGKLNQSFGDSPQGKWLLNHCTEYGFILRYTQDKMKITGIIWEPWHFRYVGSPKVAKAISDSGLCMEEYYGKTLKKQDLDPYLPYLK